MQDFQIAEGYAAYRPAGEVSIEQAIELLSRAVAFARENQILRLLVNGTGLSGFEEPKLWERFLLGEQAANAAKSAVVLAMVARAEWIDRDKFGVLVARNRGLLCDVFSSETEALSWLLDPNAK
jgi:hypothetical protein